MVASRPRLQRSGNILSQAVGVFDDDVLLLCLASRSRIADSRYPRAASGQINPDDLAFEAARRADAEAWES